MSNNIFEIWINMLKCKEVAISLSFTISRKIYPPNVTGTLNLQLSISMFSLLHRGNVWNIFLKNLSIKFLSSIYVLCFYFLFAMLFFKQIILTNINCLRQNVDFFYCFCSAALLQWLILKLFCLFTVFVTWM